MGTSKGYITPTKKEWTDAKRAATQLSKENNLNNRIKLANRYAMAMKQEMTQSQSNASKAIGKVIGLIQGIQNQGLNKTLKDLNKEYLINKSSEEILDNLLGEYSEYGNTKDNYLAMDALSIALKVFEINSIEDLLKISIEDLLKEILINYVDLNFKFRYEEQIIKKNPIQAEKIIIDMSGYIDSTLREKLNVSGIQEIDFYNLDNNKIIEEKINDAYNIFKDLYEEE